MNWMTRYYEVQEEWSAVIARAKAAEAERDALAARVAELEAALAAAAWHPGDEEPPALGWYQTIETPEGAFNHDFWDGDKWMVYPDDYPVPTGWRPIPPLPLTQEPTP